MTLINLLGNIDLSYKQNNRGLEMVFGFGKKKREVDLENPSRRSFIKKTAIATAGVMLGGAEALVPEEAQAYGRKFSQAKKDFHSSIKSTHESVQRAYAYFHGLANYRAEGVTHYLGDDKIAARIILGLNDKKVNDSQLNKVPYSVTLTCPIYAIMRAKCAQNLERSKVQDSVNKGNTYWPELIKGINSYYNGKTFDAIEHFTKNIFEIVDLRENEFEEIRRGTKLNIIYKKSAGVQNAYLLANKFNDLNLDKREWILNEVVWPHIKRKVKAPKNNFDPSDKNIKWKNLFFSLGLLALMEDRDGIKGNGIGLAFDKQNNIYDNIAEHFDYQTFNSKLLGQKLR